MLKKTPRRNWLSTCVLALFAFAPACGAQPAPASQSTQVLEIDNIAIRADFPDPAFTAGMPVLLEWIERSLRIVTGYYDRFPAQRLHLRVLMNEGAGVQGGTTWGTPEALIRVRVGRNATAEELLHDWILVHEIVHLALPEVGRRHNWLAEGVATYVEGVARVQAGNRNAADVWAELMRAMPQGLPKSGDEGLDNTHTWGRTYWGGALFCLLADVEIRRQTDGRLGLQDALRAVANASNGLAADWSIEKVFATGDAAVGVRVLQPLYEQMRDKPMTPDLTALWRELGIERRGSSVVLHEDAPLAAVREGIMRKSNAMTR